MILNFIKLSLFYLIVASIQLFSGHINAQNSISWQSVPEVINMDNLSQNEVQIQVQSNLGSYGVALYLYDSEGKQAGFAFKYFSSTQDGAVTFAMDEFQMLSGRNPRKGIPFVLDTGSYTLKAQLTFADWFAPLQEIETAIEVTQLKDQLVLVTSNEAGEELFIGETGPYFVNATYVAAGDRVIRCELRDENGNVLAYDEKTVSSGKQNSTFEIPYGNALTQEKHRFYAYSYAPGEGEANRKAEDMYEFRTYSLDENDISFSFYADELEENTNFYHTDINYKAKVAKDIYFTLYTSDWTFIKEWKKTVNPSEGTVSFDVTWPALATGNYKIKADMRPVGGAWTTIEKQEAKDIEVKTLDFEDFPVTLFKNYPLRMIGSYTYSPSPHATALTCSTGDLNINNQAIHFEGYGIHLQAVEPFWNSRGYILDVVTGKLHYYAISRFNQESLYLVFDPSQDSEIYQSALQTMLFETKKIATFTYINQDNKYVQTAVNFLSAILTDSEDTTSTLVAEKVKEKSQPVVTAFPNPLPVARSFMTLSTSGDKLYTATIKNMQGDVVQEIPGFITKKTRVDVSKLTPGIYMIQLQSFDNQIIKTIIIQ